VADQSITEGELLTVALTATDADGPAPITFSQQSDLPGATVEIANHRNGTAELTWLSATGDAGEPYTVEVTATDADGAADSITFAVTVAEPAGP
jgi:hypothetical protein